MATDVITIRRAQAPDAAAIHRLATGYEFKSDGTGQLIGMTLEAVERAVTEGRFFVAEAGGKVIGCVQLAEYDGIAELRTLAVQPEFHGQGAGRALIERCKQAAGERGHKVLYTLTQRQAFGVFERSGFVKTERPSEKLLKDCRICPIRQMCNETAFVARIGEEGD
jgi:N-acetylglutamate synthase-like GNAT family acetyltransferase